MPDNERYVAFISYRHVEPDRDVAKWLHGALEGYRLPTALVAGGASPRLGRAFRDEEELAASSDLSQRIDAALKRADALIVICSPRVQTSRWVDAEVQRFTAMGRSDRIFALLVEGEPADAFPPALLALGREPLAADLRASLGESARAMRRTALLKLVAGLLGIEFDVLRRREEERRRRRLAWIAASAAALSAVLAGLSVFAGLQWQRAESELAISRAQREKAERLLAEGYEQLGRTELLAGRAAKALAYLTEAERMRPTPDRQLLISAAWKSAVPRVLMPAPQPRGLRVSEDGQWLAVISKNVVTVWDSRTGAVQATIPRQNIAAVKFRPDRKQLALSDSEGLVELWDFRTGSMSRAFDYRLKGVSFVDSEVTFSPDGRRMVLTGADRAAHVVEVDSGAVVLEIPASTSGSDKRSGVVVGTGKTFALGQSNSVNRFAFDSGGNILAAGESNTGKVSLWKVRANERERPWLPRGEYTDVVAVEDLALSGDRLRFIALFQGHVDILDLNTGHSASKTPKTPGDEVRAVSPDGRLALLWRSGDVGQVVSLDDDGKAVAQIELPRFAPVTFGTDGRYLFVGQSDGAVRVWETAGGALAQTYDAHVGAVSFLSRVGADKVVSIGVDEVAKIWSTASRTVIRTVQAPDCSPNGSLVVRAQELIIPCIAGAVVVDVRSGETVRGFGNERRSGSHSIDTHAISERSGLVISIDGDSRRATVWDSATTKSICSIAGKVPWQEALEFSPDGGVIAALLPRGDLMLWNGRTCEEIASIAVPMPPRAEAFHAPAAFSSTGKLLAFAVQGHLFVLDVAARTIRPILAPGDVHAVKFDPVDALWVVTREHEVWSAPAGEFEFTRLAGIPARVSSLAFDASGRYAAFGENTGTVSIVERAAGNALKAAYAGHSGDVDAVAFMPGTDLVASADEKEAVHIWEAETGRTLLVRTGVHPRNSSGWPYPQGIIQMRFASGRLVTANNYSATVLDFFSPMPDTSVSDARLRSLLPWRLEGGVLVQNTLTAPAK